MSEIINTESNVNAEQEIEVGGILRKSNMPETMKKSVIFNGRNNAQSLAKSGIDILTLAYVEQTAGVSFASHKPCVNTLFFTDKGECYFTQSAGIAQDAANLIDTFDGDVYGVVVRIIEREISGGRTRKQLMIMD